MAAISNVSASSSTVLAQTTTKPKPTTASSTTAITSSSAAAAGVPEDPMLKASREEAGLQVTALFENMPEEIETFTQTANKCADLFKTSIPHQHALKWIAFQAKLKEKQNLWGTTSQDEVTPRIRELAILGNQRKVVKEEMTTEFQGVSDSLDAAITTLNTVLNVTKDVLVTLRKLSATTDSIQTIKGKYLTTLTSKIHFEKIKKELTNLQIEASYQSLKSLLQTAIYPHVGHTTERISLKTAPTVDRLRDELLTQEPNLLTNNPYHPVSDDHKGVTEDGKE